jgi:hypothetical protein
METIVENKEVEEEEGQDNMYFANRFVFPHYLTIILTPHHKGMH